MSMGLITISALKQIVETLSAENGRKKYSQGDISRMIQALYPNCISDSTINTIFSDANKKKLELVARAKQKSAENDKLARGAF